MRKWHGMRAADGATAIALVLARAAGSTGNREIKERGAKLLFATRRCAEPLHHGITDRVWIANAFTGEVDNESGNQNGQRVIAIRQIQPGEASFKGNRQPLYVFRVKTLVVQQFDNPHIRAPQAGSSSANRLLQSRRVLANNFWPREAAF